MGLRVNKLSQSPSLSKESCILDWPKNRLQHINTAPVPWKQTRWFNRESHILRHISWLRSLQNSYKPLGEQGAGLLVWRYCLFVNNCEVILEISSIVARYFDTIQEELVPIVINRVPTGFVTLIWVSDGTDKGGQHLQIWYILWA